MSTTQTGERSAAPSPPPRVPNWAANGRRGPWAAVAAAVVLLGTAAVILWGRVPLPSFPDLAAAPDPAIAGTVAYLQPELNRGCIRLVPASGGESTELTCRFDGVEALFWTPDANLLVLTAWEDGLGATVVDPESGATLQRVPLAVGDKPSELNQDLYTRDGQRLVVVDEGRGRPALMVRTGDTSSTLLTVEGPADYRFEAAQWSPDGNWVLLTDNHGRLLVLGDGGTPGPRVLVDVGEPSWVMPAWYVPGTTAGTVDPANL